MNTVLVIQYNFINGMNTVSFNITDSVHYIKRSSESKTYLLLSLNLWLRFPRLFFTREPSYVVVVVTLDDWMWLSGSPPSDGGEYSPNILLISALFSSIYISIKSLKRERKEREENERQLWSYFWCKRSDRLFSSSLFHFENLPLHSSKYLFSFSPSSVQMNLILFVIFITIGMNPFIGKQLRMKDGCFWALSNLRSFVHVTEFIRWMECCWSDETWQK